MFGRRTDKKIPGFKIERQIAEGGMATVFLAQQVSLARPVALKVLKQSGNPAFSERFLSEGRTIAALRHQNVITIHDIGVVKDQHYISMEYIEGGDLASAIDQGFKPAEALDIVRQLASCLSFVHQQGVVHRDIKPANILFRHGIPLLTDFGIAKQLNEDSKLTLDGTALGSPHYLSPEQGQGQPVDGRSDIYSLGIVLYEMLTGKPPYEGKTPIETVMMHVQDPLPPLKRSLRRYMPLLERMTAKKPTERFRNGAELEKAIAELLNSDSPTPVVSAGRRKKTSNRPKAKASKAAARSAPDPTITLAMDSMLPQQPRKGLHGYAWLLMLAITLVVPAGAVYWPDWFPAIDRKSSTPLVFDWSKANFHSLEQASEAVFPNTTQSEIAPQVRGKPVISITQIDPVPPQQERHYFQAKSIQTVQPHQSNMASAARPKLKPATAATAIVEKANAISSPPDSKQTAVKKPAREQMASTKTISPPPVQVEPTRQSVDADSIRQQNHFMALAKQRFRENKLTRPRHDNAAHYYKKVLSLEPTHVDAKNGLTAIAERYADLTLSASKKNNFDKAHTYLKRGLRIDPKNPRLTAMKTKFKAFNKLLN